MQRTVGSKSSKHRDDDAAQNLSKAMKRYRAHEEDKDIAMCNIALCHQFGRGTSIDLSTAAYWYLESASCKTRNSNGTLRAIRELEALAKNVPPNSSVLNNLGVCYEYGYGVTQNLLKTIELCRRAADLGNDVAMCNLGLCYQFGKGTSIDLSTAAYWYLQSAKYRTTNSNGTLRAICELEALAENVPPNTDVLNNLGICYEYGYVVTKNSQKALELFTKAGICNLTQNNIKKKLACFLRNNNRDPKVITIFEENGHCLGFTFLHLYSIYLEKQPIHLAENRKPIPRDDHVWLSDTLMKVNKWDGRSSLSKEDENNFERLTSLLMFYQGGEWYNLPIKQGELHDYFNDTHGRKLTREYSIASRFTQQELAKCMPLIIHEGKIVLLLSDNHYVGFIKLGELFYFIDSESPKGLTSISNLDELCKHIFSACSYAASIPSPFALTVFGLKAGKLDSKEAVTVYPSQARILKKLHVFDPGYRSPASNNYALGCTDLHRASWIGCMPSIQFILDNKKNDLEYLNKKRTRGETALMMAARNGQIEVVQKLLEVDVNMNSIDNNRYSAIIYAAEQGYTNVVQALLKKGADQKDLALVISAREGHVDTVLTLIEYKAKINYAASDKWTALTLAAKYNHVNVVRLLLANKADIDLRGPDDLTALTIATQNNNVLLIKILKCHPRINVFLKDSKGQSARKYAKH